MKKVLFLALFAGIALTGIYTVITVYDSNMKFGRLFQTPVIRPHEEPLLVMDNQTVPYHQSELLVKEILKERLPVKSVLPPEQLLANGKKEYQAFCSHCHGNQLDGLGTVGQSFHPLPTNLTGETVIKLSDQEIFTVISYGSKKTPALASSMSVESRHAVIQYLRYMQKNAH